MALRSFFIFLLLSVILITCSVLVFSIYSKTPLPPSPTPVTPNTSLWKTYTNYKYGFEFKYPPNWENLSSEDGRFKTKNNNTVDTFETTDPSTTIAQYLQKVDLESQTAYEGQPSLKVQSTTKTVINGLNCIQRQEYLLAADLTKTNTYFKNGSVIVSISLTHIPGNNLSEDILLYNRLLSTFKLVDALPKSENKFCGGIAGILCPAGFTCKLDGNYPDAGGTCIQE